jgi:hypothetical protein
MNELYGRGQPAKATYEVETDTVTIAPRDERIKESDEVRPGVIADFGYDDAIVRFEILAASKIVKNAHEMQFAVGE